jgi:hypothetical protein
LDSFDFCEFKNDLKSNDLFYQDQFYILIWLMISSQTCGPRPPKFSQAYPQIGCDSPKKIEKKIDGKISEILFDEIFFGDFFYKSFL